MERLNPPSAAELAQRLKQASGQVAQLQKENPLPPQTAPTPIIQPAQGGTNGKQA